MNDSKYFLTFDFKILYCPNINFILSCKELNLNTLEFTNYDGDLKALEASYEIKAEMVHVIVQNILNGEIGLELDSKEMKWLNLFDTELRKDSSILNNERLVYNYLILKLQLIGFSAVDSKSIITKYFEFKRDSKVIITIEEFIRTINQQLDRKIFWVCNGIESEKKIEYKFIETVLSYKRSLKYKFDFQMFKESYINVCKHSFVMKIYEYNNTSSYLVKRPLSLVEQVDFLIYAHKSILRGMLENLIEEKFFELSEEGLFQKQLIDEMSDIMRIHLKSMLAKKDAV